jgi:iron complex outermembrane receptor protein
MVNADLRWLLPDTRRFEFSLFLKASNLLDEDARRHTSMVKAIAPLPGRNYSVAFRAGF